MARVLLLGGSGQLGTCIRCRYPRTWDLHAPPSSQLDVTDASAVQKTVAEFEPDLVINAAAFNRVDEAERHPEQAYAVNALGADHVAHAAKRARARLIHISTDYVFDGLQNGLPATEPYHEDATPHPLNVYGKSKHEGELTVLASGGEAAVLRTAWLYSEHGRNFVRAVLARLTMGEQLRVVSDQIGSPTYAGDLADAVIALGLRGESVAGIWHVTGAEAMSWYRFACRIVDIWQEPEFAGMRGTRPATCAAGDGNCAVVVPITSHAWGASASRPAYSVLSCEKARVLGITPKPLDSRLRQVLRAVLRR
ncbi:MAG: dTDP-4-dehydrorhamnose reductase [Candidimonas sp.]|nr:MAG: dTDP-4-dehydrorhamnose reductase [Candidimonas sp.]